MTIGELINKYGNGRSPYSGILVNHLPMAQFALYRITNDIKKVEDFSKSFDMRANQVKNQYPKVNSIEECVGVKELYESCLDLIKSEININNMDEYIKNVLNMYELGVSSGLFHTLIRVAYAVEGVKVDEVLICEVARALAYYITAYKPGEVFPISVAKENVIKEMDNLIHNPHIRKMVNSQNTLGKKLKALYMDPNHIRYGFLIEGSDIDKIKTLLELLIPAYKNTNNIVVLHCITGLHAMVVLKDYFNDISKALDILTTSIITHLMTVDNLSIEGDNIPITTMHWDDIIKRGSESSDIHTIKLSYTCWQLGERYGVIDLKDVILKRIGNTR